MGQRTERRCPQCGYRVLVSGGIDEGIDVLTMTVTCLTCRRLYDVVIDRDPFEGEFDPDAAGRACPKARGAEHECEPWVAGGPCPRCGEAMEDGGMRVEWD